MRNTALNYDTAAGFNPCVKRYNLTVLGQGETCIVFGHGFGCDQTIWRYVAPAFNAGYRVVLFDYVGCGKSDLTAYNPDHYSNLQAYADDLLELCASLSLQQVYFVGHSVSGAIAMLASIKDPALFKKIIAIGPSPCYQNQAPDYIGGFDAADIDAMLDMMDRNYFEWTDYLAPIVIGEQGDSTNITELKNSFLRADPNISKKFAAVTFYCDIRQQLKEVLVPVTVLYCCEDVIVPLEVVAYLQQQLPYCKAVELDATGHYPQLINPNAVITAIAKEISLAV